MPILAPEVRTETDRLFRAQLEYRALDFLEYARLSSPNQSWLTIFCTVACASSVPERAVMDIGR